MRIQGLLRRLEAFPHAFATLVQGLGAEDYRFKPPSGAWSILEIARHLLDEDAEDFPARLRFILEGREGAWPSIDPEGWARERKYNEADLHDTLAKFTQRRAEHLRWLRSLPAETDWAKAYAHPKFGPIRAGDLLAAWAAHDALHLRQAAKRLYELAGEDGRPFSTAYAGAWGP